MLLVIFTINILYFPLGLGITVDTSSLTIFLYTFFPKVISIKLSLITIFCYITKELKIDTLSLTLSSVIFMVLLGSVNYYWVMPYVKVIMFLGFTKLDNILTRICLLVENSAIKANDTQSLAEGIYNIITKFPIIGRYLESFRISNNNNYNNISSPFKRSYHNPFKYKVNVYPLASISRFNNQFMFRIIENKFSALYLYEGTVDSLELQLRKNYMSHTTALISDFPSIYSNFTCNVKLICSDQIVDIYSTVKNNSLEQFYLERMNIEKFAYKSPNLYKGNSDIVNLSSDKKSSNSFLANSYDSLDFIRNYNISPPNQNNDIQVFMEQGFSSYDYSLKVGESYADTGEPSNLNMGKKRQLESENIYDIESIGARIYPCIDIKMVKMDNKDLLSLKYDPEKLSTEDHSYLNEICLMGRTVLFNHYIHSMDLKQVREVVDNFSFKDIFIQESNQYSNLLEAFNKKHISITGSSIYLYPANLDRVNLFSKIYLDDNLDYTEVDNEGDSSSLGDFTEVEQDVFKEVGSENHVNLSLLQKYDLTKEEIITLTNWLKSSAQAHFIWKDDGVKSCRFHNLGINTQNGVTVQ